MFKSIDSRRFLRVFEKLGHSVADTAVGAAIALDPLSAFVFSVVTGSSYLDDDQFPYTVKGLTKLFNAAFSTKPIWGLLDSETLGFTPRNISRNRPYIFDGAKFIVPVDVSDESSARDWIKKSRKLLDNPEHHLLFRIETWKNGNGMEPLLEYAACERFRGFGYLVETQVPLSAIAGSPDFLAIRNRPLFEKIGAHFGLHLEGSHIIELATLFNVNTLKLKRSASTFESIDPAVLTVVGEAKVGGSSPLAQLKKYASTGFYSQQMMLLDREPTTLESGVPSLFISSDDAVRITHPERLSDDRNQLEIDRYREWYQFVVKCYLLVNYDQESIYALGYERGISRTRSLSRLITELAARLDVDEILHQIPMNN